MEKIKIDEVGSMIFEAKQVEIRDVPEKVTNEEVKNLPLERQPFLYASGNWGPGYVSIKGCVGWTELFSGMVKLLAARIKETGIGIDFVAGLMTGGAIPGYQLSQILSDILEHPVRYMYLTGTRRQDTIQAKVISPEELEDVTSLIATYILWLRDEKKYQFDFLAGVAPSGMVPAFRVAQILAGKQKRDIPFVYIREQRKAGGLRELITGAEKNPRIPRGAWGVPIGGQGDFGEKALRETGFNPVPKVLDILKICDFETSLDAIPKGSNGIIVEELVNFAESTGNAAQWLREQGYIVQNAATILNYENPEALKRLEKLGITLNHLFTLSELLGVAKRYELVPLPVVEEYERFLATPLEWQAVRGLVPIKKGGTI